jgi:hypothetical protein
MFEGAGHLGKLWRREKENLFLLNYVAVFRCDYEENNDPRKNDRIISHNSHYTFIYCSIGVPQKWFVA